MAKNTEFAKYASDLNKAQDHLRTANEELIKLSQRFGRMVPKFQRLDPSEIISWFKSYSKVKDCVSRADAGVASLLVDEQVISNPMLSAQVGYYLTQRSRFSSKAEVLDDILSGVMEDLLENSTIAEAQRDELKAVLEETVEKSRSMTISAAMSAI